MHTCVHAHMHTRTETHTRTHNSRGLEVRALHSTHFAMVDRAPSHDGYCDRCFRGHPERAGWRRTQAVLKMVDTESRHSFAI